MSIETIAPQIMVNGKIYAIISQDDLAALRARIAELDQYFKHYEMETN